MARSALSSLLATVATVVAGVAATVVVGGALAGCPAPVQPDPDDGGREGEGEGELPGEGEGEGDTGAEGEGEGEGDGPPPPPPPPPPGVVRVTLLTVSDWHGQLDPLTVRNAPLAGATCAVDADCGEGERCSSGSCNAEVAGAGLLATYFADERAANENTLTVTAGDAFGGTPPLSSEAALPDEPAVKAMRLIGFDVDTLGNHNFDRGLDHLQRLLDIATAPAGSPGLDGAPVSYVSSNLTGVGAELSGVEVPFVMKSVGGVDVAFVGLTNDDAAALVFPGRLGALAIESTATAAMSAQAAARAAGADVVVALVHMGLIGFADAPANTVPVGPVIDFANAVSGFDVIVADHTDVKFSGVVNGQLVVENKSKGATYARVSVDFDPAAAGGAGAVVDVQSAFVQPKRTPAIEPSAAVEDLLAPYRAALSAVFDEDVADAADLFPRDGTLERLAEAAIGNLVTDALRAETGTRIAFVNGGGLRAAIPSSYVPVASGLRRPATHPNAPWDVVVGDIYAVLPFGNSTATFSITPALLHQAMEHGLAALPNKDGKFPQISGFTVAFDATRPAQDRVLSITLDGDAAPLSRTDSTTQITAATSDFVVVGGDGYAMLRDLPYVLGDIMAEDLLAHVRTLALAGALAPAVEGRLTNETPPPPAPPVALAFGADGGAPGNGTLVAGGNGIVTLTLAEPAAAATTVTLTAAPAASLTLPASVTIASGSASTTFRVYVEAGATGTATITAAVGGGGGGSGTVDVVVGVARAPAAGDLVINEIMFDVPTGAANANARDYNCDGVADEEDDEFVEIVNTANAALALDGVSVWDTASLSAANAPLFVIDDGVVLGPGESLVVLASFLGFDTGAPWCALADVATIVGDAIAVFPPGASDGVLNLNNSGGDSVTLTATNVASSAQLATASYAATAAANVSQVRAPDVTGAFASYSTASGAMAGESASPGTRVDTAPFATFDPLR